METIFLSVGLVCLIGAIIGGGLSFFHVTLPVINTEKKKIFLALFGIALIAAGVYTHYQTQDEQRRIAEKAAQSSSAASDETEPDCIAKDSSICINDSTVTAPTTVNKGN